MKFIFNLITILVALNILFWLAYAFIKAIILLYTIIGGVLA